jgi:hypothetical protein
MSRTFNNNGQQESTTFNEQMNAEMRKRNPHHKDISNAQMAVNAAINTTLLVGVGTAVGYGISAAYDWLSDL